MKKELLKKPMRLIKHKAYAVVQSDMLKDMPIAMVFNTSMKTFSDAIFTHEYAAERYADRFRGAFPVKVIECVVSFKIIDKRRKKV